MRSEGVMCRVPNASARDAMDARDLLLRVWLRANYGCTHGCGCTCGYGWLNGVVVAAFVTAPKTKKLSPFPYVSKTEELKKT